MKADKRKDKEQQELCLDPNWWTETALHWGNPILISSIPVPPSQSHIDVHLSFPHTYPDKIRGFIASIFIVEAGENRKQRRKDLRNVITKWCYNDGHENTEIAWSIQQHHICINGRSAAWRTGHSQFFPQTSQRIMDWLATKDSQKEVSRWGFDPWLWRWIFTSNMWYRFSDWLLGGFSGYSSLLPLS